MKRIENAINNILTLPESDQFNASIDLAHALKKITGFDWRRNNQIRWYAKTEQAFWTKFNVNRRSFEEVKREVYRVKRKRNQRAEICNTNEKRWGPEIANYFRDTKSIS